MEPPSPFHSYSDIEMTETTQKHRALVADDDPIFTSMVAECLDGSFETTIVDNGAAALDLIEQRNFELAIIDLDMPRIDGFRLLGLLSGRTVPSKFAILVITGSRSSIDREEARRLGADGFLTKPVDWARLPDLVRSLIAAKTAR